MTSVSLGSALQSQAAAKAARAKGKYSPKEWWPCGWGTGVASRDWFSRQLYHSWPCANHVRSPQVSFPFVEWGMQSNKLMYGEIQVCLEQETTTWRHPLHLSRWNPSSAPLVGQVRSVTPTEGYKVTPLVSSRSPSSLRTPGSSTHSLCQCNAVMCGQGSAQAAQVLAPYAELHLPMSIFTALARGFM